ncbi:hypothetical protein MTY66_57840 [Mycolicibacterium sp. TY66]|uniref:hypothetical protein n=1 Tax=unclassified Mycolicibacterium TaxID=2636767 RepID=UPI001BB32B7D|nr:MULTISPECIES: hypothetical protein [unclassified Mycolicibacterium]BCI84159.1 hypothetical protein MTY66_57840 [Mycolicibacterium sp. TY66]BCJ84221.1 hypothetical protein MTY81_55940 [Mycolicibacterium sp. TY81]
MNSEVSGADWLRYAAAIGWQAVGMATGALERAAGDNPGLLTVATGFDVTAAEIGTIMTRSGDIEWYDAGWPVATVVDFEDCDCTWAHVWHPDPVHDRNRYQPELALISCPHGGVHRLIVLLPGMIETATEAAPGG